MKVVVRQRVELADSFVPGSGAGRRHLISSISRRNTPVCLSVFPSDCHYCFATQSVPAPCFCMGGGRNNQQNSRYLVPRGDMAAGAELLSVCLGLRQLEGIYFTLYFFISVDLGQST